MSRLPFSRRSLLAALGATGGAVAVGPADSRCAAVVPAPAVETSGDAVADHRPPAPEPPAPEPPAPEPPAPEPPAPEPPALEPAGLELAGL